MVINTKLLAINIIILACLFVIVNNIFRRDKKPKATIDELITFVICLKAIKVRLEDFILHDSNYYGYMCEMLTAIPNFSKFKEIHKILFTFHLENPPQIIKEGTQYEKIRINQLETLYWKENTSRDKILSMRNKIKFLNELINFYEDEQHRKY